MDAFWLKQITPRQVLLVSLSFYPLLCIGYIAGRNGLAGLEREVADLWPFMSLSVSALSLSSAVGLFSGRRIFWHSAMAAAVLFLLMGVTFVQHALSFVGAAGLLFNACIYLLLPVLALTTLTCTRRTLIRCA